MGGAGGAARGWAGAGAGRRCREDCASRHARCADPPSPAAARAAAAALIWQAAAARSRQS
eukprot:2291864-Prymnesium_polylepis.1